MCPWPLLSYFIVLIYVFMLYCELYVYRESENYSTEEKNRSEVVRCIKANVYVNLAHHFWYTLSSRQRKPTLS